MLQWLKNVLGFQSDIFQKQEAADYVEDASEIFNEISALDLTKQSLILLTRVLPTKPEAKVLKALFFQPLKITKRGDVLKITAKHTRCHQTRKGVYFPDDNDYATIGESPVMGDIKLQPTYLRYTSVDFPHQVKDLRIVDEYHIPFTFPTLCTFRIRIEKESCIKNGQIWGCNVFFQESKNSEELPFSLIIERGILSHHVMKDEAVPFR